MSVLELDYDKICSVCGDRHRQRYSAYCKRCANTYQKWRNRQISEGKPREEYSMPAFKKLVAEATTVGWGIEDTVFPLKKGRHPNSCECRPCTLKRAEEEEVSPPEGNS